MSRMVFCRKFQQELEGLARPPFPGPKGQDIYDKRSIKALDQWLDHRTMLINEKHPYMTDMGARTYLSEQMTRFCSGEEYDQAEGYVLAQIGTGAHIHHVQVFFIDEHGRP